MLDLMTPYGASKIVFYSFGFLALFSACMVIFVKHPVRAVLFLVLSFFATAAIWLLLEAEFLAMTLILVYVGAVMVLFLFVVMMLDIDLATLKGGFAKFFPLGLGISILFLLGLVYALKALPFSHTELQDLPSLPENYNQVKVLGQGLYSQYLFAFEIAGILLLVAMIAAISLTFRGRRESKAPDMGKQAVVRKSDRISLFKDLPSNPLSYSIPPKEGV